MASFPSLLLGLPSKHTAQTLSQDPSPGGHGCACLTWKGPRFLPRLTRPPPLPGSHSSSPRAFSPAGTPTLKASGLCSPAPALQTLVTLIPSVGRHPSSSVPDATSDPGLPRFPLLVLCVGELKIASVACAPPGKDLVFPGVGPQGTDEVLVTNAPAFGPVLRRCLSSHAWAGLMSTVSPTRCVTVDKARGLSQPQFPQVQQEDRRCTNLGGHFKTEV